MADLPTDMVDFYKKYGDEIKALRMEMGASIMRRMESDDRSNKLKWAIASMAVQELMSSIVATLFRTREDRMRFYPEIMKMLISDTEQLCEQEAAE